MERKILAAALAILALALALRYYHGRGEAVPLDTAEAIRQDVDRALAPQQTASSYTNPRLNPIFPPFDKDANADTGVCPGSSIKDILSEYGKVWGRGVKNDVIGGPEADALMKKVQEYFICRAIIADDTGECGPLPENPEGPQKETRAICGYKADTTMIAAYMAGRNKSFASCARFCKRVDAKPIQDNPAEYCPKFARGMETFCDEAPPERLQECRGAYPSKRSDCDIKRPPGDDNPETCPDRFDLYHAMRAGNPEHCPDGYKGACKALISRDMSVCSAMAAEISVVYCAYKEGMFSKSKRAPLKNPDSPAPAPANPLKAPKLDLQPQN